MRFSLFRPIPRPSNIGSGALLRTGRDRRTVEASPSQELRYPMLGTLVRFTRQVRRPAMAIIAVTALVLPALPTPLMARGPEGIADIAEKVIDAVVNISTSQNVTARNRPAPPNMPNIPNDPQLDDLFRDFFNRRGQQGDN